MAGDPTVRDLAKRAGVLSQAQFASALGPFVLIGPPGPQADASAWSYATRHGDPVASTNPFNTLLESVAHSLRKKDGAAFGSTILIGRTESNDICIPDPSVSKLHARVSVEGYVLSDAGSTNGTFVGEKRLRPGVGVPLHAKLKLRFGDRTFQVYSSEGLYGVLHTVRAT